MEGENKYFLTSIVLIILSTPLARLSISIFYSNQNLASEYLTMLKGFIDSYKLLGVLIFILGLVKTYKGDDIK